ncbi:autotransporter domain-containing protein [Azospirillum palustre]
MKIDLLLPVRNRSLNWRHLASASVLALAIGPGLFQSEAMAQSCTTITGDTTITSAVGCQEWVSGNISITNSGTISGGANTALYINTGALGTLTNSGVITSTGYFGVYLALGTLTLLNNTGSVSAGSGYALGNYIAVNTLTNSGTISARRGIGNNNGGSIGTLGNSGTIVTAAGETGNPTVGIENGDGTISTLTNSGLISVRGTIGSGSDNAVAGVLNKSNGVIGLLTNTGSMTIAGTITPQSVTNTMAVIANMASGTIGTIVNSGSMVSSGTSADRNQATSAVIVNRGQIDAINNQAGGTLSGVRAIHNYANIGAITNDGTITGTTSNAIFASGGTIGTLTNNGLIQGSQAIVTSQNATITSLVNTGRIINNNGSAISSGGYIGTLTNSGTISAGGTGIFISTNSTIGAIVNSGTITGSTALYLSNGVSAGPLTNSGLIAGPVFNRATTPWTINGGSGTIFGTFTGTSGGIGSADRGTLSSGGNLVFGSGNILLNSNTSATTVTNSGAALKVVNPITITGNYVQTGGSIVSGAASAVSYGYLSVSGSASVTNSVVVISGAGLSAGNSFTIVRAGTSGSYTNDTASVEVTSGLTAAVTTVGNDLVVTLVAAPPPPPSPPVVSPPVVSPPVVSPPVVSPPVVSPPVVSPPVVSPPVVSPPVVSPPVVSPPVVSPPPLTGVIDTSKPTFTNGDGAVIATDVVFDGGTLKPGGSLTMTQGVTVYATNGYIDSTTAPISLTGQVGGPGSLAISGANGVTVSGTMANAGGVSVQQGLATVASGGTISNAVSVGSGGTLAVARGGIVNGSALSVANGGSAAVSGIVVAPVSVSNGGSVAVNAGGGIAGAGVSVSNASLAVNGGGVVSAPVSAANGGSVTVEGAIMAPVTVSNATLTVNAAGSTGAVTVSDGGTARVNGVVAGTVGVGNGATLGGGGTILGTTTIAGTLSPGNSPGTLTVQSAVTMTGSATYRAEIDGPTAGTGAGHHDQLVVQGSTFTAAGTLAPVLRGISGSATNSYVPALGSSYTVVSATGGVLGSFDSLVQPSSGLAANTRFDTLYDATTVRLVVTPGSYAAIEGGTRNQRAVGSALDVVRPAAGTRLATTASGSTGTSTGTGTAGSAAATAPLFSALYGLDAAGVAGALDQLSGKQHADGLAASLSGRRLFGRAVGGRMASLRDGTASTGLSMTADNNGAAGVGTAASGTQAGDQSGTGANGKASARSTSLWGQPLAAYGRTGGDGNASGSTQRAGGFLIGADHGFETGDATTTAGVALGYLRSRVGSEGAGTSDIDSYQATLYGSWVLGGSFVEGAAGYGFSHYDSQRGIAFGSFAQGASGKANGHDLSLDVAAGQRLELGGLGAKSWIEPRAGLRFDRITRNGFREDGGVGALDVEASAWNSLRGSLGARAGTSLAFDGWTLTPTATAAWLHDFGDVTASTTSRLAGAPFTVDASRTGRNGALLGIGAGIAFEGGLNATIEVQDEVRSRGNVLSATAALQWKL